MKIEMMALAVAFATAGAPVVALGVTDPAHEGAAVRANESPDVTAAGPDTFMKKAAAGGIAEVELGKLAQQNASSDAVKKFGQQMVTDHGRANEELKTIASKKGVELPTQLDAKHAALRDKLAKLSGTDFDRAYMAEMTKDHQKDLAEFEQQAKGSTDDDVKAFASRTLPVLEGHLREATKVQASLAQASR